MTKPIRIGIVGIRFTAQFHYTAYLSAKRKGTEVEMPIDSAIGIGDPAKTLNGRADNIGEDDGK